MDLKESEVDIVYESAAGAGIIVEGKIGKVRQVQLEMSTGPQSIDVADGALSTDALRSRIVKARDIGGRRMKLRRGITMDSGASANVMPRRMVRKPSQIRPSPGSRAGVKYVAANDGVIYNEGE